MATCEFLFCFLTNNSYPYLCQSEAAGCGFHTGQLVPQRLRHILCHQRVRGLDLGEGFAHGGGGVAAVEIEGDGKEKAALKEEQLEKSAPGTPEAEAHFGLAGLYYWGLLALQRLSGPVAELISVQGKLPALKRHV